MAGEGGGDGQQEDNTDLPCNSVCNTPRPKRQGERKAASDVPGRQRNPGGIGVAQPLPRHFPAVLLHQRYTGMQCQ